MTKRARYWVLRLDRTYKGNPLYFEMMTGIGPATTSRRGDAMRFPSKRKALQHEANDFPLTDFTPEAVRG